MPIFQKSSEQKFLDAYKWSLILETQIHDSNIVFANWNQRTCQRFNNLCSFNTLHPLETQPLCNIDIGEFLKAI